MADDVQKMLTSKYGARGAKDLLKALDEAGFMVKPKPTEFYSVRTDTLKEIANVLTGYGEIVGIDHEGTITWRLLSDEGEALAPLARDAEQELRTMDSGANITRKETK